MRPLRCRACGAGAEAMTLYVIGTLEYLPHADSLEPTGETGKPWLQCECGVTTKPRRSTEAMQDELREASRG